MSLPAIAGLAVLYGTGMDTTGIFYKLFQTYSENKEFSVQPQASVLAPTPFVTEIQDCATSPDNFLIKLSFMINPGFQEESYIGGILRA